MTGRRQEKVSRVIKEVVSDTIANHLSDPRIESFVSVTRVEVTADLRNADVYLSMFGGTDVSQNTTFEAISHARSRIQSFVAAGFKSKYCPTVHLYKDEQFKRTIETMNLIERAADQVEAPDQEQRPGEAEREQ